jgi:copper homeostasis protein
MSKGAPLLEVIACSVADAIEAQQGGAGRLEIISDFARGGLTPPLELVREIIALVSIPVRVMLRASDGYGIGSEDEKDRLCDAAREFSRLRIDGLVLGFLRKRCIDVDLTQMILGCAPSLKATFHHAFEEAEPLEAIREIKKIRQVDRILTHGGAGAWPAKIQQLATYRQQSLPEIEIVAGGGLDEETIAAIASMTSIREFHVGRAARASGSVEGVVQAARVKALVDVTRPSAVSGN